MPGLNELLSNAVALILLCISCFVVIWFINRKERKQGGEVLIQQPLKPLNLAELELQDRSMCLICKVVLPLSGNEICPWYSCAPPMIMRIEKKRYSCYCIHCKRPFFSEQRFKNCPNCNSQLLGRGQKRAARNFGRALWQATALESQKYTHDHDQLLSFGEDQRISAGRYNFRGDYYCSYCNSKTNFSTSKCNYCQTPLKDLRPIEIWVCPSCHNEYGKRSSEDPPYSEREIYKGAIILTRRFDFETGKGYCPSCYNKHIIEPTKYL